MRNEWLTGYVLHRRSYRETSFLVDFFTLELGKVRVVAKGVRGAKSDRKSLLQPLQSLKLQLTGRGDLKNLKTIEANASSVPLTGQALFCAFYVNELVNRLMPEGLASESVYNGYQAALHALNHSDDVEPVLRQFEFIVLEEMGVMPDLGYEANGGDAISPSAFYVLSAEEGLVFCSEFAKGVKLSGQGIIELQQENWTPLARQTAKLLCRLALKPLLGDKPLKSRELFAAYKR